jgi:phosphoribosylformimino-5-aminoimidazole carboxamide ribotide isomerase
VIVVPAIDLMAGNAVRLTQGDKSRSTIYDDDPAGLVERFARAGAKRIHVVDLDGAFEGKPAQAGVIEQLAARARSQGAVIQTGGGIRDEGTVQALLRAGVDQVVIGTLAAKNPELTERLCREHEGRILVAVDERDGKVAVAGWQEDSGIDVHELARRAEGWGAAGLLHTDVSRDGMQVGPAIDRTAAVQAAVTIPVYASGGVGSLEHLHACRAAGIAGVVLGRAIYEGAFTIEEALATSGETPC